MMIKCPHHGYQLGLQMSQDLARVLDAGGSVAAYRIVVFEYRGEIESKMYISEEFANKHDLTGQSSLALPEQYPEWYLTLVGVCEKCAAKSLANASR